MFALVYYLLFKKTPHMFALVWTRGEASFKTYLILIFQNNIQLILYTIY